MGVLFLFFFFSLFLSLLEKKDNSHRKQELCPSGELQTAQASNCLCREQWIFPRLSSLKNALWRQGWHSELTCKVIFVISLHLLGHPHPCLHHNRDNELQLQPDTIENKEIN